MAFGPRRPAMAFGPRRPGAAKAGEDLAADGQVPVAEGGPSRHRVGGPRAAAQHLVPCPEEHLRVLAVGEGDEPGVGLEVGRGPLPDVADELVDAEGTGALGIGPDRRWTVVPLAQVRSPVAAEAAGDG